MPSDSEMQCWLTRSLDARSRFVSIAGGGPLMNAANIGSGFLGMSVAPFVVADPLRGLTSQGINQRGNRAARQAEPARTVVRAQRRFLPSGSSVQVL